MHFMDNIILNTFSVIILFVMLFGFINSKDKRIGYQDELFITMIASTIFNLIVISLSKFEGNPGTLFSLVNQVGNFLIFATTFFIPTSWFLYVHYQIFQVKKLTKKLLPMAILVNIAYFLMTVLSRRFGWFYIIDENNIYHNGPYFEIYMTTIAVFLLFVEIMIINNRKKINKLTFNTLLFIPIVPLICVFIQMAFSEIELVLNGVVISLSIIFVNIQSKKIDTDYLTGIFNRNKLDKYIENKIKNSTKNKTFSAVMIDLDDMKEINDNFGHAKGDELLRSFAKIIKNGLDLDDFSARIGGDEFCIVCDTDNIEKLEEKLEKIEKRVRNFNEDSSLEYKIKFSKGYAVYDFALGLNEHDFLKVLDEKMYKDKKRNLR